MKVWRYAIFGVALTAGAQQRVVNFYSVDREIEMGAAQAGNVAAKTTLLSNAAVSAYVDRVVQRLAGQIPDSPFRYEVTVVKDNLGPDLLVLPGGYIFLSGGLITAAQSESEFVGLVARAMADVANRVATRQLTRAEIMQIAVKPLENMDGWQGYAVRNGMGVQIPAGMAQFRRQLAVASDAMAVQIMAAGGYDPAELVQYVTRAGKSDGSAGWDEFQQKRLAALRQAAAAATVAPRGDGADFARVRDALGK